MDAVLAKYLDGKERSLTTDERWTSFWVHLRNRKGWQKKTDKGMREIDLRSAPPRSSSFGAMETEMLYWITPDLQQLISTGSIRAQTRLRAMRFCG